MHVSCCTVWDSGCENEPTNPTKPYQGTKYEVLNEIQVKVLYIRLKLHVDMGLSLGVGLFLFLFLFSLFFFSLSLSLSRHPPSIFFNHMNHMVLTQYSSIFPNLANSRHVDLRIHPKLGNNYSVSFIIASQMLRSIIS